MSFSLFKPDDIPSLSGKVYVVTGATSGLGLQTATHLLAHGARVYLGSRSTAKYDIAVARIRSHPSIQASKILECDPHILLIDHLDLKSVVKAAEFVKTKEKELHCLVNNAAIMGVAYQKTTDGYESQWQTNYVAHWLLTYHLMPKLISTSNSPTNPAGCVRIVNVAAPASIFAPAGGITFDDMDGMKGTALTRYGMSKCGNILHILALNRRYGPDSCQGNGIWTASLHPGVWVTNLQNNASGSFLIRRMTKPILHALNFGQPADKGAYTTLFAAASEEFGKDRNLAGKFFMPVAKVTPPDKASGDLELAEKLWQWTEREMKAHGFID